MLKRVVSMVVTNEIRLPLCTCRLNWAGEPTQDGEMNEMTLHSRHRIRNSSPGGLRSITLPLGHGGSPQYSIQ